MVERTTSSGRLSQLFLADSDIGAMRVVHRLQRLPAGEVCQARQLRGDALGDPLLAAVEEREALVPASHFESLAVEASDLRGRLEAGLQQEVNQHRAVARFVALDRA